VLALSFAARALSRHLKERAEAKEAKERFTEDTCQMLSLPRVLAWNRGRAILADLDEDGNSVLVHRNLVWRIPSALVDSGIEAWNITQREALIILAVQCPDAQE
jgi:hypothetical protein